jgi:hypothetical protein
MITRAASIMSAIVALLSPAVLAQTNTTTSNANNNALATCVQAADQKYNDTWDALCNRVGKQAHCIDFVGSPKDKEFPQLRLEEMTLCSKLYR